MSSNTDIGDVEAIVRAAGTSFYRGMAILPPPRRQAMYAIYAFCRIVDDIADEESPFASRTPRLEEWRTRIAAPSSRRQRVFRAGSRDSLGEWRRRAAAGVPPPLVRAVAKPQVDGASTNLRA